MGGRVALGALVLGAVLALPYIVGLKLQILSSVIVVYAIVAVSLVVLTGWAGQISLGQWGIAGVGAMVAGGLAAHLQADFFLTIIAAGMPGAVVSLGVGCPGFAIPWAAPAFSPLA